MRKTIFLFLGFLLLLGVYSPPPATSQAINLVQNEGFETGDFSGWTQSGDTRYTGVGSPAAHSGTYGAYMGPVISEGFLSQVLTTTPGQSYTVSFWLGNSSSISPNHFNLSWGGTQIFNVTNAGSFDYTQYSFVEQATSSSTTLTFGFQHEGTLNLGSGPFRLDDINVSPVPIPGALVLFGSGLVGLAGIGRRRMRK